MIDAMHAIFAGGGTGGHLYPGLAVAEALARRRPDCRISFCGTGNAWERSVVARHGYAYRGLPAFPLLASPAGMLRALYSNGVAYRDACRWIRFEPPSVVVGLGGYAAVPLSLAAAREGIPLVLLEQNLIPGRANRLLARWASVVCAMFAETATYLTTRAPVLHTGNPVRNSIVAKAADRANEANPSRDVDRLLLVLGGSQGAHSVNQFIVEILPSIARALRDWEVIHQTGARDADSVRAAYEANSVRCTVTPFIDDVASVYSRATLAICRAGATTLAELSVSGVPAILLPYPYATANHQWHNAQFFGRASAAIVVKDRPEPGRTAAALVSAISPLLRIPQLRHELQLAMLKLAQPDAADSVASIVLGAAQADPCLRRSA